jgi:excinuclease UvrABC nuclease subunit
MIGVPRVEDLPNLSVYEYTNLPACQGLYIVVNENKYIYIGKAQNSMRNRWYAHHRLEELLSLETARIHFLETDLTLGGLIDLEAQAVLTYKPVLNFINKKPLDKINLQLLKDKAKRFRSMIELENDLSRRISSNEQGEALTWGYLGQFINEQDEIKISSIKEEFAFTISQEVD